MQKATMDWKGLKVTVRLTVINRVATVRVAGGACAAPRALTVSLPPSRLLPPAAGGGHSDRVRAHRARAERALP